MVEQEVPYIKEYIYSKGVYTITISDKCPFITFYDTSEMNLEQKNLFSNIVSFYKKNYTLYNKYKGDLSRFGSDITLAMFIWGLSDKKLNTFFIDCIDQKSNKYILNQANIIYKLIQEFYKSLTQDTATVSGA